MTIPTDSPRAMAGKTADPVAVTGGVTVAQMRRRTRFVIVSDGLNAAICARMKTGHYAALQDAVGWALGSYGRAARVSVITYGAELFPMV